MLHFQLGEVAALDDFRTAHAGTGKEEAFRDLDGGHFTGEEQGGLFLVEGDVLNDVEQEGGFPHGGTRRNDEHVPGLEAVAFFVQLLESRGQPLDLSLAGDEFFKVGDGLLEDACQALFVLGAVVAFPYLEDVCFHGVQKLRDVVGIIEGLRGGLVGNVNDGAQDEFVLQDVEVVLKVGSRGGEGVDFRQPGAPAYRFQLVHYRLLSGRSVQIYEASLFRRCHIRYRLLLS